MLELTYKQIHLKMKALTSKQRKLLDVLITLVLTSLLVWAFWSFFQGQVVFDLFANDATRFRNYLSSIGPAASGVYLLLVLLEVLVAFIPGWFVYPVGAAIFGFTNTILLVTFGNLFAASLSFWIGRRWGKPLLERFIAKQHMEKFDLYMERNGMWAVFFLKLNPITSLDIWNYVAGASNINFWKFTIANILGILPLIVFSAALGEEGYNLAPQLLGLLLLFTILYVVWFFVNLPTTIKNFKNRNTQK